MWFPRISHGNKYNKKRKRKAKVYGINKKKKEERKFPCLLCKFFVCVRNLISLQLKSQFNGDEIAIISFSSLRENKIKREREIEEEERYWREGESVGKPLISPILAPIRSFGLRGALEPGKLLLFAPPSFFIVGWTQERDKKKPNVNHAWKI